MFIDIDNEQKLAMILKVLINKLDNGKEISDLINKTISFNEYDNNNLYYEYIDIEISNIINKNLINQGLVTYTKENVESIINRTEYETYETQNVIGSGSFANVYKARHKLDKEYYAIKRVFIDTELYNCADDILHEIKILARITHHPNIMRYHHSWIDDKKLIGFDNEDYGKENQLFLNIQLELCDYTLREYMCTYIYDIDGINRVKLWSGLLYAVKHLHENNIIHRDIKPSNIFIKNGILKLGDFGLSRIYGNEQTYKIKKSIDIGCSYYRAPEIDTGLYDSSIDVYSSGIILLELLLNYTTAMEKDKLIRNMMKTGKIPELLLNDYGVLITKMIATINRINIFDANKILLQMLAIE